MQPKRRSWTKWLVLALVAGLGIGGLWLRAWHRKTYPFGSSHCCIGALSSSLRIYAAANKGLFPAGGDTPEASLSLLEKHEGAMLGILRGKTIPRKETEAAYLRDGKLGPESCGWFYIEGLSYNDDPRLAVLWDKYGLGHNGQWLDGGGHEVILVDGSERTYRGTRWDEFLVEQRKLFLELRPDLVGALDAWATNNAFRDSRHEALKR